jgi:hypothetical protein
VIVVTQRGWVAAISLVASMIPAAGEGLPLYASREGRTCNTCHIDPNGGGIRNDFGFMYGKNRHSMGVEDKWSNVTVDPQLNEWIRLGVDFRFMYYASHIQGSDHVQASTFFPMQGNLRVAITPMEQLAIVGSQGIVVESPGFPSSYVARELYALFRGFAHGAYIQAGRFRIPFGLRQEDHTSFTRTELPYDSQREDAGIEIGAVGTNWFGQASVTNGEEPFGGRVNVFAAKVGRAAPAFQFGLSAFSEVSAHVKDTYRGSLYASTTRGRLTFLGEYVADLEDLEDDQAAFAEVVYRASRGVNVRAKFDYAHPRPFAAFRRYLGEVDLNPMPFANVKVSYRYYNYDDIPDVDELFAMLFVPF